ncbi:MAG: nickel pincer cofactor biosynthesis protein LarC [Candidatus Sumerlaeia bacterium]
MNGRFLYFDCYNGISGDMTLGALVDLGVGIERLREALAGLPVAGWQIEALPVKRLGISGTQVRVRLESADAQPHRHLNDVERIIREAAGLSPWVKDRAMEAFTILARAEARVHQTSVEKVHFHEVGAVDAIVDIVGAMAAVEQLGVRRFFHSPLPLSHGEIQCAHGRMPVPAPATLEILLGAPWYETGIEGELVTPTGAAILRALCGDTGHPAPVMAPVRAGYGAGSKHIPGRTNFLRVVLADPAADQGGGEAGGAEHSGADPGAGVRTTGLAAPGPAGACSIRQALDENLFSDAAVEDVVQLECEIDNMPGEAFGHLMEQLMNAGALDVHFLPVQMKKNRPGTAVRVLAAPGDAGRLMPIILAESTTLGVRVKRMERVCLAREADEISTALGPILVKIARLGGRVLRVTPEFESLRRAAGAAGLPLLRAAEIVRAEIERRYHPPSATDPSTGSGEPDHPERAD